METNDVGIGVLWLFSRSINQKMWQNGWSSREILSRFTEHAELYSIPRRILYRAYVLITFSSLQRIYLQLCSYTHSSTIVAVAFTYKYES